VVISAFGWRGPERKVFGRVQSGNLRLVTSPSLLAELTRVLAYPKFGLENNQITAVVHEVESNAKTVHPRTIPSVIREDPSDNHLLACASFAGVYWIVSGDRHLLALEMYEGIPIVTARQLLDHLDGATGD
jgi:putative PIN family toxin of toxin-antitoxin system